MEAVRLGRVSALQILLQKCSDMRLLDVRDKDGMTPLMYAVINLRPSDLSRELIHAGCNLDLVDNNGQTVLIKLILSWTNIEVCWIREVWGFDEWPKIESDQQNLLHDMIRRNVNLEIVDNHGYTALDYAQQHLEYRRRSNTTRIWFQNVCQIIKAEKKIRARYNMVVLIRQMQRNNLDQVVDFYLLIHLPEHLLRATLLYL